MRGQDLQKTHHPIQQGSGSHHLEVDEIAGIARHGAGSILAEIGADMGRFPSAAIYAPELVFVLATIRVPVLEWGSVACVSDI